MANNSMVIVIEVNYISVNNFSNIILKFTPLLKILNFTNAKKQHNIHEKEDAKKFIQKLDEDRRSFASETIKIHENVIGRHKVVSELIEGICFSPPA